MAGSAFYNIVYMRERVSTSNTYRVTGGDRGEKTGRNNSLMIKKRYVILSVPIQKYDRCCIYSVLIFCCNLSQSRGTISTLCHRNHV